MSPLARAIKALDRAAEDFKNIAVAHPHLKVIGALKRIEDALEELKTAPAAGLTDEERCDLQEAQAGIGKGLWY